MVGRLLGTIQSVAEVFTSERSPKGVAAGLTWGLVLGLLPKDNLLAAGLGMMVLCLQVNLPATVFATALFSALARWVDLLADPLGEFLLTYPPLLSLWSFAAGLPLARWTSFNNTAVLGNVILGIVLAFPLYRLSLWMLRRWQPWVGRVCDRLGAEALLSWAAARARDIYRLGA